MKRDRLTNSQIVIVRSLLQRGGHLRPVTIERWQRKPALPPWRRGLIEVWYRQSPSEQPSLQGPYYALSIAGAQLASSFFTDRGASRVHLGQGEDK